ncbi:redoxin family protein [Vibrio parahaemolyticus]|uniref:redoxin family protein n=1 Tax=Vibrio parahaemolyticus TaxID=670 RepID=UPI00084A39BD|nr:redoxin family protein [Vibrio parahaemolyticus]ODY89607.1 thioredoxin peroxidase [Vibrio parahaemolyticus]
MAISKWMLISTFVISSNVLAGFEITKENEGLGVSEHVTLEQNTVFSLSGKNLKKGDIIPEVKLTDSKLNTSNTRGSGKVRIYNVLVSVDTPVCVEQSDNFHELAKNSSSYSDEIEFVNVSADTPFAQARFISQQAYGNEVTFLSDSLNHDFGTETGAQIRELGLLTRAVIVVGKDDKILHVQRVPELTQLPDLAKALDIAKRNI